MGRCNPHSRPLSKFWRGEHVPPMVLNHRLPEKAWKPTEKPFENPYPPAPSPIAIGEGGKNDVGIGNFSNGF